MSLARHNPKRDANEARIVEALRLAGCLVERISGAGVPDLLVWSPFRARIILLEVKDGSLVASKKKLKPEQKAFHDLWKGSGAPVFVVESVEEAVAASRL